MAKIFIYGELRKDFGTERGSSHIPSLSLLGGDILPGHPCAAIESSSGLSPINLACMRFHKELFFLVEGRKMVGGDHLTRTEFFFSSSLRNKKIHARILLYPIFSTGSGKVYIHTHLSASAPSKPLTNSSMLLVWSKWSSITRHSFGGAQSTRTNPFLTPG